MLPPLLRPRHAALALEIALVLAAILAFGGHAEPGAAPAFVSAKPLWPAHLDHEKNVMTGFRTKFISPPGAKVLVRMTGSSICRVFLNDEFIGYGPARGPHGYYRVDEVDLTSRLASGENRLAIEVAGYNVNSYYLLNQPAFLQAEVVADGQVLASTAGTGTQFEATLLAERVQKVQRYSFQRPFTEVYRLRPGWDDWRRRANVHIEPIPCAVGEDRAYLPRRVTYPKFEVRSAAWDVAEGALERYTGPDRLWKDRSLVDIGPKLEGFPENELDVIPSIELQKYKTVSRRNLDHPISPDRSIKLEPDCFHIVDFGAELSGFIGARLSCDKKTHVYLTFDEILSEGDVDFNRLECVNAIAYELEPGTYDVESFEPYALRYLKVIALDGGCKVDRVHVREYANPDVDQARFSSSDRVLNQVFEAARETFRQNTIDVFMDCPSRERAGWANDALWTARAAFDLSGNSTVEKVYFENYLLPEKFPNLPDGMLPMCYPADHIDGIFIPNCALWFVIQLEEYLGRSGDRAMVDALRPRVLKLLEFIGKSRNSDGLLEKLSGWVFIEWSAANSFTQDVNYPSNMEYVGALEAAGRLYNIPSLLEEASKIRQTIIAQSYNGSFFVDNAIRKNGKLEGTGNQSEVCQYMAFYFGLVTPQSHPKLWRQLRDEFGPSRDAATVHPGVHKANAIIGNYLRMELLSHYGSNAQMLAEAKAYYSKMADKTGTLWEHDDTRASCNHGFASHVAHLLLRDALGIRSVDLANRCVTIGFETLPLDWCEGRIPWEGGDIELKWWREGRTIHYRVRLPESFSVKVENPDGFHLERIP